MMNEITVQLRLVISSSIRASGHPNKLNLVRKKYSN